MDYKDKYGKALERARAFELPEYKNIVESIFPELRESEGEKVEKAIFGMVFDSDNELWSSYDVSKSDVLAWLEKQGVQKPVDMGEPKDYSSIDPHFFKPTVIDEGKAEMDYCFTKMMNGEKVSPAWSEEDERICRNLVNDIANEKSMCKYEISKGICDEQINWLKSLKQRIGG